MEPGATRITILVDNNVQPGTGLMPEHGFSALIERPTERALFDTGQGPALVRNSLVLKTDLEGLALVALSHGHYDHTGGLLFAARLNPGLRVITHPRALQPHLAKSRDDDSYRDVGIPHSREDLEAAGVVFDFVSEFQEILNGIWFTGQVPRIVDNPLDPRLVIARGNRYVPDPTEDDASLLLQTARGPVLLLGCAHAGVRNILEHVKDKTGLEKIHAVIGGTHLGMLGEWEALAAIEAFEQFEVQIVATSHCTGEAPNRTLRNHFGKRFCRASAGTIFEF